MPEAVIVSALRTPIGTAMKGTLRDTDAYELADHVVGAAAADLDSGRRSTTSSSARACTAAASSPGTPRSPPACTSVPGLAINRHCAAGQAAVQSAAASIRAGHGPADHRGRRELRVDVAAVQPPGRQREGREMVDWFPPTHPDRPDAPNMDMSITVGWNAAVKAGVSREEMDEWALGSHRKAIAAIDEGRFKEEIVPIDTPHGLFDTDEHPRRDTTIEKLAVAQAAAPRDRGLLHHRGQCLRRQRRLRRCSPSPAIAWGCPRWPPSGRGRRSASTRRSPVSRRSRRSRKR